MIWRLTATFTGTDRNRNRLSEYLSIDYDNTVTAHLAADLYTTHHIRFKDGVEFNGDYTDVQLVELEEAQSGTE